VPSGGLVLFMSIIWRSSFNKKFGYLGDKAVCAIKETLAQHVNMHVGSVGLDL
jgi:hypothetical protein